MAICQHKGDDKHQPKATSPKATHGDKHRHKGGASTSPRQPVVTSTSPKANRGDEAPAQGGHKDQPKATRGDEAPARRQIPYIDNVESTARTDVEGSVASTVSASS